MVSGVDTAVDREVGAGDVVAVGAGEIRDESGDFLGATADDLRRMVTLALRVWPE